MATIKLNRNGRFSELVLKGRLLTRSQPLEAMPIDFVLTFLGDPNLTITFDEADRKDLKKLDPKRLIRLSRALDRDITTHDELCNLLLPSKPKAKKPASKPKKSSLTD